ncbi:phenylalanine--tRNA ligase beta subunit [Leuconostoc gasicomitatum]|uniref:Phenylalanine--tRNA ligase beta subunit n=3 Tax=Leuconostoc TaxID=1243 RepID=A0A9Q3SVY7_9LACO|nr:MULTISPECIES: phenylalanine--tRNA ligase subunit beta [Leuconostoc]MBZ5956073.1 phenylalanine--tRNA ligase subunit beta [Leuconostoc gasicomitatum]MBZ5957839.1 phenylalanine--tRNA ligase subunit beta [Leuconostoc gasicomitatum]MBZ5962771.1 phenylalanine--tRNA ligase subunit beta [Leuconostoc gasicomitatum]MBZ5966135.1 phenylalanine--tRNA ligase subunit beta [Leuconostoc gasicomitatum]MBZ5980303.1 phenylalanine--tRNA ligase subunit beta [Leuconostoc gasicomitatum]
MKTSLKWLNEYLNNSIDLNADAVADLAERVERTSVEISETTTLARQQDGLVVARVVSVLPHPDSDHMVITQVDIGESTLTKVVTGAPNVAEGQLVVLAKVGAHIINHETGELNVLKPVKLRGEDSNGMLVALQEIGFDSKIAPKDFETGIYVFNNSEHLNPGDDALSILGMTEPVLDTDLTPNRADMLSMIGTAYEFGAMLKQSVTIPDFDLVEYETPASDQVSVMIRDDSLASKYAVRVVNHVKIGDSPLWLQKRLWNAGMRPINNIVDITNYMMLMYGQPLHAFDLDKLNGQKLYIRRAEKNEELVTLDGQKRDLRSGEDIVIATDEEALMLAGVMGGLNSEVDENTENIVLEGAIFNPSLVRATARRHNLHSEASARFERGVNWDATFTALDHAASLVDDLAGGQVARGRVTAVDTKRDNIVLSLTAKRVNQILGTQLTLENIALFFKQLAFDYTNDGASLHVTLPARRADMSIEADLIEEIARLYGYDNLPVTLPYGPTTPGKLTLQQRQIRASRHIMESLGLNQAISYALTTPLKAQQFAEDRTAKVVSLDYPMSSDRTTARQNLLAGLLEDVAYNINHSVHDIALYEQGRVFIAKDNSDELPIEIEHIAGVLTGNYETSSWQHLKKARAVDFYDIKGIVSAYLDQIGVENVRYVATDRHSNMHPGQTADIYAADVYLGFVGQIHPLLTKSQKMAAVFGFELNLFAVMAAAKSDVQYNKISRFPQMSRDAALLVDESVQHAVIETVIRGAAGSKLVDITLFDVYTGDNLPHGKRSLAYSLTYQDNDETLVEAEVNSDFERVTDALVKQLNVEVR